MGDAQSKKVALIPCFLIFVWAVVLYARTIGFASLSWDDPQNIFANPYLQAGSWAELARLWQQPYFGLYIPLTYTAWGMWLKLVAVVAPSHIVHSLHLLNVLIHAVNGVLFLLLLGRYKVPRYLSLVVALLFVSHPIQAGTVSWISGFRDLFGASLGLAALNIAHEGRATRQMLTAAVLFWLSILAKPSIVTLPVVAVIMDRRCLRLAATTLICALPCLWLSQSQAVDFAFDWVAPLWFRLPVALDTLTFYGCKLFMPMSFGADYGRSPEYLFLSRQWLWTWLPSVVILMFILYKGLSGVRRGAMVVVVILLPVLGLMPFLHQNFSTPADHYAYLGFIGLGAMLSPLDGKSQVRHSRPQVYPWLWYTAPLLLLSVLSVLTVREQTYWANNVAFYRHMVAINPRSFNGQVNLAAALIEAEPTSSEAEQSLRAALVLEAGHTLPLYYLSRLYLLESQPKKVLELVQPWEALGAKHSTRFPPRASDNQLFWSYIEVNGAIAAKRLGDLSRCDAKLQRALAYAPQNAVVHYQIGLRWREVGQSDKALQEMTTAAALDPQTSVYQQAVTELHGS